MEGVLTLELGDFMAKASETGAGQDYFQGFLPGVALLQAKQGLQYARERCVPLARSRNRPVSDEVLQRL